MNHLFCSKKMIAHMFFQEVFSDLLIKKKKLLK